MKQELTRTLSRRTGRLTAIAFAALLVLPAIPASATPDSSKPKHQSVERRQPRSVERKASPSRPRERAEARSERGRSKHAQVERHQTQRRRDQGRGDDDRGHDGRGHDRRDRYDRYDHHDRHDHRDRGDRRYRYRWYDHHNHHDHSYDRGPYFYRSHVHRHFRPIFTIPRVIRFGYDPYFDPYYWGRIYHDEHHHFHTVYYFPVYVDDDLVYRPYSYCEGSFYATGYFTAQGPLFDITIAF